MLASFVTAVAIAGVAAATGSPQWEADYGKALQQVRSDDRPLLVVLDKPGQATEQVDPELLGQASASDLLSKYDLCRVDVTTEYGKKVADAFGATEFPHLAVIDKTGSVVLHSHKGEIAQPQLTDVLAKYQSGQRPQRQVVMKPASTTTNYSSYGGGYSSSTYCPSCQRGY